MKYIILCLLCASTLMINGQSLDKAKMDQFFDAIESNQRGMGSLSIYRGDTEVYQRSIGMENVEKNIKATAKTRYRMGSISKTYTAAIIMQMVEEGKLKLSTHLAEYYPQFANADKITIENLLQHRSGLFNFTNDPNYLTWMEQPQTHEALIARMLENENTFEPGAQMEYSNTGYLLLAYIAEKIDGKVFSKILEDRITKPHGLKDTYYGGKIGARDNEAQSYKMNKETWAFGSETDMSVPSGAGALVATPSDINKFFIQLFSGKIISDTSVELMKTMNEGYGFALFEFPFGTKKAVGHNGGIDGFQSSAGQFGADDMTICYIANGADWATNDIMIGALSIYYGEEYPIPDLKKKVIADDILESYVGVYSDASFPLKLTIVKDGDAITAQATGQGAFPLEAEGDHKFNFSPAGIKMIFDPAANTLFFSQGERSWTLKKE